MSEADSLPPPIHRDPADRVLIATARYLANDPAHAGTHQQLQAALEAGSRAAQPTR